MPRAPGGQVPASRGPIGQGPAPQVPAVQAPGLQAPVAPPRPADFAGAGRAFDAPAPPRRDPAAPTAPLDDQGTAATPAQPATQAAHPAAPGPTGGPVHPAAGHRPAGPAMGVPGEPYAQPYGQHLLGAWALPEEPVETTTRLRPVRDRHPARTAVAVTCLVLGLGLMGGAAAGAWWIRDPDATPARTAYTEAATLWHSTPVDALFPRTLKGDGAGPGGADRVWTRVAVAPDAPCATALQPRLAAALEPAGCMRVLRATYTDATATSVTTIGVAFMDTDAAGMTALHTRFTDGGLAKDADLIPPTLSAPGTVAAGFGDAQRASWHIDVLTEIPVIVYGVSGFADGRPVTDPQPAQEATAKGQTTAPAQAGLGHDARGVADRIEHGLRQAVAQATAGPADQDTRKKEAR